MRLLSFDTPGKGANLLASSVLDELATILVELEARADLAGLIVKSAKPGSFIAGADIREFIAEEINHDRTLAMCRRGQSLLKRLAAGTFVTVAAIDGVCFGGGAELALWCDQRLMASHAKTEFGLPEVKLGLIPGWGGTARATRIVGLANGVELICGGEPLQSATAAAWGLVADVVSPDALLASAIRLIREEKANRQLFEGTSTSREAGRPSQRGSRFFANDGDGQDSRKNERGISPRRLSL